MSDATFSGARWEGFLVSGYSSLSHDSCLIHLQPDPKTPPRCRYCRLRCGQIHDTTWRRVRECDAFSQRVWLEVPVRRLHCPTCGVHREALTWLNLHARWTIRMQQYVESLLRLLPLKHVADLTGLHWHSLKRIDKQRLARNCSVPDLSRVRYLVMDEFALFKGHRYASVAIDA